MSHLGAARVEREFRGMVRRCRDFGHDLARVPVEVGPTAHFMMGGVVIDAACRTGLEGLFAAGEDAGGVHGGNRLGGNGVADSTVFGGIAGDVMADWVAGRPRPEVSRAAVDAAVTRATRGLGGGDAAVLYAIQAELRDCMWDQVGLIRDGAGLAAALERIAALTERLTGVAVPGGPAYNLAWQDRLNLESQLVAAELIARSGQARTESRGSHFRRDHPAPGEDLYSVRVRAEGGAPRVFTEPVRLDRYRPSDAPAGVTVEVGD